MTSTRLPGKVLKTVEGRTLLEWIIRGSRAVPGIDIVCAAIPEGSAHDAVAEEAERHGAVVVRGPELNVLERFRLAAELVQADEVMRVTTDCPLMDPQLCGDVLALLRATEVDYVCNNEPFSYPHGLDCEAFTREVLERAAAVATDPYDREHVTPWMKRSSEVTRDYLVGPMDERAQWRWTIDHDDDLRFFESVAAGMRGEISNWMEVAAYLDEHPELHEINRSHRQR
jgi:spore coat polysaccharide biosynthesis protein SpsF (cytidylyltransferase family)